MIPKNSICPEAVAAKLARADTLEDSQMADAIAKQPRLVELIWFIQWRSMQAGGLDKLKADLLATFPEYFATEAMRKIGAPAGGRYTIAQCFSVWEDFRGIYCGRWGADVERKESPITFKTFLAFHCDPEIKAKPAQSAEIRDGAARFNLEFLQGHCREQADLGLVEKMVDLCVLKDSYFFGPWYCPDLLEMLFAFMDQHAAQERQCIAPTAVVEKVFDALDYAWSEKKLVRINGNSRFGKTEAFKTWAAMYPGRTRLVAVPPGNSNQDLVRAVAAAFGFRALDSTSGPALQRKVDSVLEHGRVGIMADESHFLFPSNVSRNTPPARLNWIRTAIVDKGLPCALSTTPQSFDEQSARFQKTTHYNMDQWAGRMAMVCDLPEVLEPRDLEAVAGHHLPGVHPAIIELITGVAQVDDSYLKAVENIASRARWLAGKRNAPSPLKEDFMAAIREVAPRAAAVIDGTPLPSREAIAPKPRRVRQTAAEAIAAVRPGARTTSLSLPESERRNQADLVTS